MGSIEVICGPMFSGKSEELIRRIRRKELAFYPVKSYKPQLDNRYSDSEIVTHDGLRTPCTILENSKSFYEDWEIWNNSTKRLIAIEEVQFFDDALIDVVLDLKKKGHDIVCAGLDMDWQGKPFNITANLMAIADNVEKLTAVCMAWGCGKDATMSYKKNKDDARVQVGGAELYEARCYECWRK